MPIQVADIRDKEGHKFVSKNKPDIQFCFRENIDAVSYNKHECVRSGFEAGEEMHIEDIEDEDDAPNKTIEPATTIPPNTRHIVDIQNEDEAPMFCFVQVVQPPTQSHRRQPERQSNEHNVRTCKVLRSK